MRPGASKARRCTTALNGSPGLLSARESGNSYRRLIDNAQSARAADAPIKLREEVCRGGGSCSPQAARYAEESALLVGRATGIVGCPNTHLGSLAGGCGESGSDRPEPAGQIRGMKFPKAASQRSKHRVSFRLLAPGLYAAADTDTSGSFRAITSSRVGSSKSSVVGLAVGAQCMSLGLSENNQRAVLRSSLADLEAQAANLTEAMARE